MAFVSVLNYAQELIADAVEPNDTVVDATVGNGTDTLFLAKCVGEQGKVYGFDIQSEAISNTRASLIQEKLITLNISLINESHENLLRYIPLEEQGCISAIMFNLGYLPGHDHQITTRPDSTLPALDASLHLLKKGGVITLILYSGHPGGMEEAEQVTAWAGKLPQQEYEVLNYQFINQRNHPPVLIGVRKI